MKGPLVKDEKQTTPSVVIISEDGLGEVFPLSEGNNVLGSGDHTDINLPFRGIDPVHATLVREGDLRIEANSDNLVLVNGRFCSELPSSVFVVSVLRTVARRFGLRLTLRVRVAHCHLEASFWSGLGSSAQLRVSLSPWL